jgi:AcrR family transcriptional regulator
LRPRKSPSQTRSRVTVDVILEATARILGEHGYAGTNTNRIAEVAGVSIGSIYQYFPNKEALVAALRDRHSRDMHVLFQRVIGRRAGGSLLDGIAALVSALMQAHRADIALHVILETRVVGRERQADHIGADQAILRLLRAWLNRHRREITVPSLDLAAHFVLESIVALVHSAIQEPPAARPQAIEAEIVALVMAYLSAPRRLRAELRRA